MMWTLNGPLHKCHGLLADILCLRFLFLYIPEFLSVYLRFSICHNALPPGVFLYDLSLSYYNIERKRIFRKFVRIFY